MSNVVVNLNGRNIEVISVEDLGDKKRIFIGDVDSDVILRSMSGVKVQVGTKIVDLNLTYDGNNNSLTSSSLKQYQNIEDNFSSIEGSLEDGDLLYDTEKGRLYVYSGGALVRLTNTSDEKQYLSFLDHQSLTGDQKILMLKNAGLSVSTLKSLTTFLPDEVFANMFVYVAEEKQHYCLVGDNPRSQASWSPVYLSTEKGGTIKSGVIINPENKTTLKQAFHINGYYDSDTINDISETQSIFTIGDVNLNKGLAAWANTDGNIYIESLDSEINTGFIFNTKTGNLKHSLLYLQGERVGINTTPKQNYSNAIGGRTLFEDKIYIKDNISTELFAGGFAGYGMRLGKDPYGYWTLDIDNLSVRQRMSVYELVVNQIKATNGSLWVSDGAKIKSCIKYAEMPVYVKARYAGNYRSIGANQYEEIPIEERPPYAKVFDPIENSGNLIPFKMGLGYGDYYLDIPGDEAIYTHPGYDTYVENNGVYSMVSPTHRLDPVLGFVEDTGGEYVLVDTVNIYGTTYEDMPPFFEGDLIRMQSWDPTLNAIRFARCQVGIQRKSSDAVDSKPEVLMYVFQKDDLVQGLSLVRVGNNKDAIMSEFAVPGGTIIREKTRGLQIVGATWIRDVEITQAEPNRLGAIYLTAADSGAPYIDIIDKVASHNAFNPASSEPNKNSPYTEVMQTRLKVRLGKLATLVDLDMGLDGGLWQTNLYGLYTDSGFFKGNLVAQAGKIGDFFLKEGVMFTYNDGNVHTPMDFAYENNNNPTTSTGKINTNYLFGKSVAGVLLDGRKSRFSLGNRLTFENGVLTIGEVDGIGDLVTIINNLEDSVDADFINALKGNFTSISGGLISTSVVRLGSVTRDIDGNITGWVDRAGMSGLDDSGETSVRLWAGETLANRNIAPFRILQNGSFYSTKGEIAGWTIAEDALYKDKNTVGTGMFSSVANNVAFYAGTTYANLKLDKENAAFYVLDDGSFKSTKGTIGSMKIANDKLYTSYLNGYDKMRLDNNGLSFFEDTGLERAGIKNTAYTLGNFINGNILSFNFSQTYLSDSFLDSITLTVTDNANFGAYDSSLELTSLEASYNITLPAGYEDPGTYDITVNYRTDFILTVQKLNGAVWEDVSEIGRIHKEVSGTTIQNNVEYFVGAGINHITGITQITSSGSYRVQLSRTQDIDVIATDSTTGNPITPTNIVSGSRLNLYPHLPSFIAKTVLNLKRTGTFMHLKGLTIYSSVGAVDNFFNIELDTTGFFLNSKGSFQIVAPTGGYSNIPGVLITGEVNGDGSSASYWTGGVSTAITRRTAQGRYEVDVRTCLTHTNWYPAVICKYNPSSFIKASAQVSKENVDVGGLIYNRLTINVFDTDNGISIDCPFYFYVFGRNEEFSFV